MLLAKIASAYESVPSEIVQDCLRLQKDIESSVSELDRLVDLLPEDKRHLGNRVKHRLGDLLKM